MSYAATLTRTNGRRDLPQGVLNGAPRFNDAQDLGWLARINADLDAPPMVYRQRLGALDYMAGRVTLDELIDKLSELEATGTPEAAASARARLDGAIVAHFTREG